MPIITRRPAPAGAYCGTCGSTQCSHAAGSGSTTPLLRRSLTLLALATIPLILGAGVASAKPADAGGRYAGYDGVGIVKYRMIGGGDCEGPALYIINDASTPDAVRRSGPIGNGWVCVNWAAYNSNPRGSTWSGETGVTGRVG